MALKAAAMSHSSGMSKAASTSLPTGTVTFLFTDIEGSTQRWEAHRVEMEDAVGRHDALLRAAVAAHDGSVFKTVGDACCAAFARPQDAVAAAVVAQQTLSAEDFGAVGGLPVRMAIHTGTAQERDGDYFGPTVNRVARLLSIGHGGQVLVSGAAHELLAGVIAPHTSLRDLGEHQLRDLARPEQVYQLIAPGLGEIFPALRSLDALPNNLPRQATAFVGREQELADVKALLRKSQVVTLVGTGGIGKTRTALQVGADMLDGSGDGVWLVDLAQVASAELVTAAIASVFGLQAQNDPKPLDDLCLYLKNKRLLLILDNCEHVVGEMSRVVAALVRACPQVSVLATSREALNVHGEQVYRMPTLSVPPRDGALSAQEALGYGGIALFVARASALDARFVFTDDKAAIIADICRRLDGIALAIELAAARVTILNLKQLSQKLDERFRLLTGGDRTALPRQQTMRAAIDWSYELLTETERTVFRRLAVFQGGWTLEAASAICTDAALDEFAILDNLTSLVNKSLVSVEFQADTQRYVLLESLRQYGIELLHSTGEYDALARRHADFFAAYTGQILKTWQVMPQAEWIAFVDAEIDNIRAALHFCLEQGNDKELGAQMAEHLWVYWFGHGSLEGRHWLEAARAAITPAGNPRLSAAIDLALSRLLINYSWDAAFAAVNRAVEATRAFGDDSMLARALFYSGEAHLLLGELDEAETFLMEARAVAQRVGDQYREIASVQQLAKLYANRKQVDRARQHYALAKGYYENRGAERNWALAMIDEARLERSLGDAQRSIVLTAEALRMAQNLGDRNLEAIASAIRGCYLVMDGEYDEAEAAIRQTLVISRDELNGSSLIIALHAAVGLAMQREEYDRAARFVGYTQAERSGAVPARAFSPMDVESLVTRLRERLGEQRLQTLTAEGATWSLERGFEEALAALERR